MVPRKLLTDVQSGTAPPDQRPVQQGNGGVQNVTLIIILSVLAFVTGKIVIAILLYWRWFKKNRTAEIDIKGGKMMLFKSFGKTIPSTKLVLKKTQNLTNSDIIGSGGYGVVYKLVVDENTAFAVKKLPRGNVDQERGFEREVEALSDIKHRNVVALRGYYTAPNVNLLIYDLMLNGSLESLLYGRVKDQVLSWPARLNIALGTARGLAYLHHDCIPHIIHRDIKTSNILLDENLEPHVSDFGLANLLEVNKTHATTIVAGTFGYLAPEYMETGKATKQCDVFSYGVVLLELITGRRPIDAEFVEKGVNLIAWVKDLLESGHIEDAFDKELRSTASEDQLREAIYVACHCLNIDPMHRPTMQQVVKMLERVAMELDDGSKSLSPKSERSV